MNIGEKQRGKIALWRNYPHWYNLIYPPRCTYVRCYYTANIAHSEHRTSATLASQSIKRK